jgi:hypothetical protein
MANEKSSCCSEVQVLPDHVSSSPRGWKTPVFLVLNLIYDGGKVFEWWYV